MNASHSELWKMGYPVLLTFYALFIFIEYVKYVCILKKENEEIIESNKKEVQLLREDNELLEEELQSVHTEMRITEKNLKSCLEKVDLMEKEFKSFRNELILQMNLYFSNLNAKINIGIHSLHQDFQVTKETGKNTVPEISGEKKEIDMNKENNKE